MSFRKMTSSERKEYLWDLAERVGATFVEGFLGVLLLRELDVSLFADLAVWHAAILGGANAVLALGKGWAAKYLGRKYTASLLPKRLDT